MKKKIRLGTRGSRLALWQAAFVESELRTNRPDISVERVIIKTEGDRDQSSSLTQIGGQGVFTKTIENALLEGRIDIAVHSLKDLPSKMADGLVLGAVPQRGPVEDVLVTRNGISLGDLPRGARIATGSIRRRSQLLNLRPDLNVTDLRGNIDTRLRKLEEENLDAIIMARAALVRLGLDEVAYYTFSTDEMIPSVGQGAIGVQIRAGDKIIEDAVSCLVHLPTHQAVTAERAFLSELDSGCQFPVGAFANVQGGTVKIIGFVGSKDGKSVVKESHTSGKEYPQNAGRELAVRLRDLGAADILDRFRNG
jgi:hydroxymethylbilane synthase